MSVTFTWGHRDLDLLSITGEWMTGGGAEEVTRDPRCSGVISSQ